jgi:predicted amidohydrolase YtcJ
MRRNYLTKSISIILMLLAMLFSCDQPTDVGSNNSNQQTNEKQNQGNQNGENTGNEDNKDDVVTTENGTLAGSTLNMLTAVKNLMKFANVTLADAVICASLTPAKVVGIDNVTGSIEIGKRADISILDNELNLIRNM